MYGEFEQLLLVIAMWAMIPGFVAKKKGRSFCGYYFLSFLISPLVTLIIVACLKNISGESDHSNENVIGTTTASEAIEICRSLPNNTSTPVLLSSNQPLDEVYAEEHTEQIPGVRKIQYCRRCGFKLIDESKFCSRCGTRIEKESGV